MNTPTIKNQKTAKNRPKLHVKRLNLWQKAARLAKKIYDGAAMLM